MSQPANHSSSRSSSLNHNNNNTQQQQQQQQLEIALTKEFSLSISAADAEDLSFLSVRTGLSGVEAQRLGLRLREASLRYSTNPEQISKWVFDHFFRDLVAGKDLNDLEKQKLSFLLSSIFSSLDYRQLEIVNQTDLLAALSLLCAGSKSAKLAFGFAVYDEEGMGVLRKTDFVRYIRSLLAMLFSCTRAGREMDEWTQKGILRDITRNTWQEFSGTMNVTSSMVSFEQFSQWYNAGGFEKAPWLELLDVKKWPKYKPVDAYTATQAAMRRMSSGSNYSATNSTRRRVSSVSNTSTNGRTAEPPSAANEVVFRFHLDDVVIDITRETIGVVRKLVENSKLKELQLDEMFEELLSNSSNGMIDKTGFDRCVENLMAGGALTEEEKAEFILTLSTVFYGYDRTESEVAELRELACGFSLLCAGSKSTKLAFAFDVMDADADGYLTRKELWAYFRSFICILLTLSGAALEMTPEDLNQASDVGAVFTCTQALSSMRAAQSVSFDDIAEWYTEGGFTSAPWLELLDLSKWVCTDAPADGKNATTQPKQSQPSVKFVPPPPPKSGTGLQRRESSSQAAETMSRASATAGTESLAEDNLFTFNINRNLDLRIARQDAAYAQEISVATGLVEMDASHWYELTSNLATKGKITKADYDHLFSGQLARARMSPTDQALVSYALDNLYAIFDYDGTSWRHAAPLLAGLSILTTGSKSTKLSVGFRLFGRGSGEFLSEQGLQDMLTAYLTMLFACSFDAFRDELDTLHSDIQAKCAWVAHRVCQGATGVTFQRFGQWYNTGGFRIIPWLELLDLSKWTSEVPKPEPSAPEAPTDEPLSDAFTFALTIDNEPFYVPISSVVASKVTQLVDVLGTSSCDPTEMFALLQEYDDDGLLTKRLFDRCMRRFKPGKALSGDEKEVLSNFLSSVFYGFDRAETEAVDLVELASGFSILCSGSKSSKLAFAFDLMDEDSDGFLTRRGLWRYLRSFLCVLLTLSEIGLGLTSEELSHACDSAALAVCAQLFQYLEKRNPGGNVYAVSFDDIADWYTDGGFAAAPWLELLDVCKWQLLLQSK